MNTRELIAQYEKHLADAERLLAKESFSAEDEAAVERLVSAAEGTKARIDKVSEIQKRRSDVLGAAGVSPRKDGSDLPDLADGQFQDWTTFIKSVWRASPRHPVPRVDDRLLWYNDSAESGAVTKAMSGEIGADGGYLIPPDFRAQLMAALPEGSLIRAGATVWPMSTRTVEVPALEQGQIVAGQPAWFGGLQFFWAGEGVEKAESQAKFRMLSLKAKKMIGYTVSGDELVNDSAVSLSAFLTGPLGFTGGARFMEDVAFLHGAGGNQPVGILRAPATLTVRRAVLGEISYSDLLAMMARMLDLNNAVWLVTRSAMESLPLISGPTTNPRYLWGSAQDGIPTSLMGLPLMWTEKLPFLGETGDIALVNRQYYVIGDRQAVTVETTQYDRWRHDQTSWRMVHRVDGSPWLEEPITLMDGQTRVSPFVLLDKLVRV